MARYYSSAQGRFTSIDPLTGEEGVPQSWNRYTYTLNNPLKYTDPTGEKWAVQNADGQSTFRWYDGDTIPSDWEGKWEEYTAGWYIGSNEAIRLGSSASDVLVLSKDLFSNGDWANLQNANPANLTHEQKEILFSGAALRIDQTNFGQKWNAVAESGAYIIAGAIPGSGGPKQSKPNKPGVPPTPAGMTQAQFGQQVLKWGGNSAQARQRIGTLTRQELESAGVTKQMAKQWRNFYRETAIRNPDNPSAAGRAALMDHAVKLLKGK